MTLERKITTIAAILGAILPFRALWFTGPDPATETIDLVLVPAYVVGRMLPPMGDFGSLSFLAATIATNAFLYGAVASYLFQRLRPARRISK
jgi:hypothetical protein